MNWWLPGSVFWRGGKNCVLLFISVRHTFVLGNLSHALTPCFSLDELKIEEKNILRKRKHDRLIQSWYFFRMKEEIFSFFYLNISKQMHLKPKRLSARIWFSNFFLRWQSYTLGLCFLKSSLYSTWQIFSLKSFSGPRRLKAWSIFLCPLEPAAQSTCHIVYCT